MMMMAGETKKLTLSYKHSVFTFEFAAARGLSRVCMADKSNAMTHGHALWQRVFKEVAAQYPSIQATHYYIDALAMYMVLDPAQFQVLMPLPQFILPAGLRRVYGKEANEPIGILGNVLRHIPVGDPDSGESGLAAEHDGLVAASAGGKVVFVADG